MSGDTVASAPYTVAELMAQVYALEREAVERYGELADVMETHNNHEVAALFRSLAKQEEGHARGVLQRMGWSRAPAAPLQGAVPAAPEMESAHYLMHPWHALQIALAAEQQALAFFSRLADEGEDANLRDAARELQAEEREHVALLQGWLQRVPQPPENWAEDPDPPRYHD